jgi:glycosyltransferase involved in cell wall biosynthesis
VRIVLADPPSFTRPYDHALGSALARRGHEVHLLASPFPPDRPAISGDFRVHELAFPLSGRMVTRSRARRAVRLAEYGPSIARLLLRIQRLAPDVAHFQWLARPTYYRPLLARLARRRPLVLTAHDLAAPRRRLERGWPEVLALMRRVIVHSQRGVATIESLGVPRDRIAVIPHPVFDAPDGVSEAPLGETLLFFGLLRDYKGLDVLVRALAAVPRARLVVAGDPVDPVEPVQALAREAGVAERIEWRLGFQPQPEVTELMRQAALVVLPYRQLDSSGVLATALGHGRPAIVSDVGSLGDLVREYGAGDVVAPGDPEALAVALRGLLDDRAALEQARTGALRAARELTWDAAAEAHERVYAEVIA